MSELILHHYDWSPFSEKIRLILGLKGLAWRSVIIPAFMPKPDLVALTGGYRHTPVLQIGADVFCDTRLIATELERRHPTPPLWPDAGDGLARAVEAWAERDLFWPIARYVTGRNAEFVDPRFHADRAALRGKPSPSPATLVKTANRSLPALRVEIPRVESMLTDGRAFLLGPAPGLADVSVYHALWFLTVFPISCAEETACYPHVREWMARVAALGYGVSKEMNSQEALQVAREATPEPLPEPRADPTDPPVGAWVAIRPEEYTTARVVGEFVYADRERVALRRADENTGEVVVHLPRIGYVVSVL